MKHLSQELTLGIHVFAIFGFIYFARLFLLFLYECFTGFRAHLWSRVRRLNLRKKYGQWAIITGATDGIGLEYARQLARRGLSLLLIGRNADKLSRVVAELTPITEVRTIVADLASDDPLLYRKIAAKIDCQSLDIGMLVNNAGVNFDSLACFGDQPEDRLWQLMRVNMIAAVMMTRVVLPAMKSRRKGAVINVGSFASCAPIPLVGVYSASKVFVEWFSRSLAYEYSAHNIDVQTLCPLFVATKINNYSRVASRPSIAVPTAESYVRHAIATIGRSSRTTGHWSHGLQRFLIDWFVPKWMLSFCGYYLLKLIESSSHKNNNNNNLSNA